MKNQSRGLLSQWYLRTARFLPKMSLQYKPSAVNVVADALSRAPVVTELPVEEGCDVCQVSDPDMSQPTMQLVQWEQKGKDLIKLINFLTDKLLLDDPQEDKLVLN